MSGDDAAVAAQGLSATGARARGERAAARAVLEAAGVAAAHELRHGSSPCSADRQRASLGVPATGTRRLRRVAFAERLGAMLARSFWAIVPFTLAASACGASGVSYSGESRTPRVEPAALATSDAAPPGHVLLGEVEAGCSRVEAGAGLDGEHPGDVACGPDLLLAALRERASRAGGSVLVDVGCRPDDAASASHVECSAEVWAPDAPPGQEAAALPAARAPVTPAFGVVEDFWRVELDYWPAAGAPRREPVGLEQVSELDFPRAGHVRLGDMRAYGAEAVSSGTLRSALLAGAARVGARHVVGIQCSAGDGERQCLAMLSAPAVVDRPGTESDGGGDDVSPSQPGGGSVADPPPASAGALPAAGAAGGAGEGAGE
jgi:hypothetical protein